MVGLVGVLRVAVEELMGDGREAVVVGWALAGSADAE